jgi:hypothetical protein
MNIRTFILLLLSGTSHTMAQNPFHGTLYFKMISFPENNKIDSNRLWIQYETGKYLVNLENYLSREKDRMAPEIKKILVNVQTDAAYLLDEKKMNYDLEKSKDEKKWKLEKLDSSKTYLQRNLTGYIIEENEYIRSYGWFADGMEMDCGTKPCITGDAPFMIEGKIPFIIELYAKNEKMVGLYATDLVPDSYVDTALYSLTGYTEKKPDAPNYNDTTPTPKAPMDTVMEHSEMPIGKQIEILEKQISKMGIAEKKAFLEQMEKLVSNPPSMNSEERKAMEELLNRIKKSMQPAEKQVAAPPKKTKVSN